MLPPYWTLGYHLSRWGYRSSDDVIDIVQEMKLAKIPLEVQWVDIDYMDDHKGEYFQVYIFIQNNIQTLLWIW